MFREIVVDAEGMTAPVHEVLAHRASGIGREVLERRRLGGGSRNHDRVVERVVVLERADHLGHRRKLLAHRNIDRDDAGVPLVDDRVHRDRGLAGLPVADDQLPLTPADRDHGVHGLHPGLQRLLHRLPRHDAGGNPFHRVRFGSFDRSLPVQGPPERIHHPSLERLAHRHLENPPGAPRGISLAHPGDFAEEHESHRALLEIQGQPEDLVRQFHELAVHDAFEAVHPGDPVTRRDHGSDLGDIHSGLVTGDLFPQQGCDFIGSNGHDRPCNSLILQSIQNQ